MTSATQGAKLTPATAVVGMQGSINCIGDILEKAVTASPFPPPPPPPPPLATTLNHAIAIVQTEDAGVSKEKLGQAHPPHIVLTYVKVLLHSHMAKQM
ncbi:hypothetical protein BDR07DRAFT_1489821 [Suillus spraguei]|nr:hypothetical protein BDR07DRAFT_1489821 [Suillus spraguei]